MSKPKKTNKKPSKKSAKKQTTKKLTATIDKMPFEQVDCFFDGLLFAFYPEEISDDVEEYDPRFIGLWQLFLASVGWTEDEFWSTYKEVQEDRQSNLQNMVNEVVSDTLDKELKQTGKESKSGQKQLALPYNKLN